MNKTHCSDCSAAFPVNPPGYCGGTGYAMLPNRKRICYTCADARQREELKDRSKPFVAYVGKAGDITTWTGGALMKITRSRPCQLTRNSYMHGKGYMSIHAVEAHGGHWAGRGSQGVAIKLRAVNG